LNCDGCKGLESVAISREISRHLNMLCLLRSNQSSLRRQRSLALMPSRTKCPPKPRPESPSPARSPTSRKHVFRVTFAYEAGVSSYNCYQGQMRSSKITRGPHYEADATIAVYLKLLETYFTAYFLRKVSADISNTVYRKESFPSNTKDLTEYIMSSTR